jgi:hypothetical protein
MKLRNKIVMKKVELKIWVIFLKDIAFNYIQKLKLFGIFVVLALKKKING